jgi:PAS domain S-box-containing protein
MKRTGESKDDELCILIIDDTQDDRRLAIRQLTQEFPGIRVIEIMDAIGLERALSFIPFHLAVIDYRLGWTDGISVLNLLKDRFPDRPVVMFTNSGNEEIAVEAMKAGLDDYVVKSSKGFLGLATAIRQVLERQASRRTIHRTEEEFRRLNENLEKLVEERTSQLETVKSALEQDLAERRRMEKLLLRSHDFYLTLLEEFPTLVWRSGTDCKCDYFNKAWLKFTGKSLEQEAGEGWTEGVHPDDRERSVDLYLDAFRARRPFQMEYRLRRHDGEFRWVLDSGAPFNNLDGQFAGYIGCCYDIHENKRLREDLERIVEKRTRDLAQTNATLHEKVNELERFHDVVIGRELKMIELEREVAKLRKALGTI